MFTYATYTFFEKKELLVQMVSNQWTAIKGNYVSKASVSYNGIQLQVWYVPVLNFYGFTHNRYHAIRSVFNCKANVELISEAMKVFIEVLTLLIEQERQQLKNTTCVLYW